MFYNISLIAGQIFCHGHRTRFLWNRATPKRALGWPVHRFHNVIRITQTLIRARCQVRFYEMSYVSEMACNHYQW